MRVAFAGVSHWHAPIFLEPLLRLPDVKLVAGHDRLRAKAEAFAAKAGCEAFDSLDALCDRTRPDLVFLFGRHADMAADAETLIARGVPFVVEKPAGIGHGQLRELARKAAAANVFAAVPFVFRQSGFFEAIGKFAAGEQVLFASFRFMAGLPSRYRENDCEWMLDKAQAGGGVLTNLGVHFLDLIQLLASTRAAVSSAQFANFSGEGDVEDFASVLLRDGPAIGQVETGYLYPAHTGVFDMHFSVRTEGHYFAATGPGSFEVCDLDGDSHRIEGSTTNMEVYPHFIADVVRRVREDMPPVAGLGDMANVLGLVDRAYDAGIWKGEGQ